MCCVVFGEMGSAVRSSARKNYSPPYLKQKVRLLKVRKLFYSFVSSILHSFEISIKNLSVLVLIFKMLLEAQVSRLNQ